MLEWQEVSTPPVLPPVQEQAGLQDVKMATTGLDTVVLEEDEAKLMFGEPPRKLMPAEEAEYQRYKLSGTCRVEQNTSRWRRSLMLMRHITCNYRLNEVQISRNERKRRSRRGT